MVDFTKIQFRNTQREPVAPKIESADCDVHNTSHTRVFTAEIHLCAARNVDEHALFHHNIKDLERHINRDLTLMLHHHIYGELRPLIAELEMMVRRQASPYADSYNDLRAQFAKIEELLKLP